MFTPALRAAAVARRMQDAELHRAVERDEFELFYQPIVRLADNALIGAEALMRWRHPERGVLTPGVEVLDDLLWLERFVDVLRHDRSAERDVDRVVRPFGEVFEARHAA